MSAGYIQLAAIGQQDAYLTGEPQVTYFSGVYKRHTPFVLEAYDIPFNGQYVTYGETAICRIPPKGDLIRGLTLKMTLPALYNPGSDWVWPVNPSFLNYPRLWFGLSNGTITGPITGTIVQTAYYSTNVAALSQWFAPFTPYGYYSATTNQFIFNNVANVIVSSTFSPTNAGSGVFWGFDPVNYTTKDQYGNLVYTVNSSQGVVPDYALEQSGWLRSSGAPINSLSGLSIALAQTLPLAQGSNFLNFGSFLTTNVPYWSVNDLSVNYSVLNSGLVQFLQVGYYAVRLGFVLDTASVVSISVGATTTPTLPATPTFVYTYSYTVSPNPTSPAVIPLPIRDTSYYYYFYVTVNGACNALAGSYLAASLTNEIYQFSNAATLSRTSLASVPIYGNTYQTAGVYVTMTGDSKFQFTSNGTYMVTGTLSLSNTTTESYVSNVALGERSNILYVYDMTSQGRNPTFTFSIPVVANTALTYYLNVSTTQNFSNITPNSFFIVEQFGTLPPIVPSIVLPYNGLLLSSSSTTLTSPLNLKTNFTSNGTSNFMSINATGNLVFANAMTYMLTGVFYTSSPVTAVTIGSSNGFSQTFQMSYGFSSSPPYTITVPFQVTDTVSSYGITVSASGTVDPNTFIAVSALASNIAQQSFQQTYNYYDGVGTLAIVDATLKIGGQTIQSLSGEYIEVWNELNVPYENQPGLQLLTGKYDTQTSIAPPGRTYYVNLPFYFFGSPEMSLPIVALGRQDVEVWLTFNTFQSLTSISVTNPTLQATIITEYVYLSNPEIDWFQNHQLEYVITQCQYDQFLLGQGFQNAVFELFFKHPVTELFFLIHPDSNLPYNYTTPGGGTDLVSFGMTFNGEDAFLTTTTNTLYVGALEPFRKHINFFSSPTMLTAQQPNVLGRQFYMYSFDPGHVNMSRIRQVLLEMKVRNTAGNYPSKTMHVIALNKNVMRIANGVAGIMYA
jgi:Major capsid protein N-terminus